MLYVITSESDIGGNSTTTWTEFCHCLTPSPAWTKTDIFDPLPHHLSYVVIECPLTCTFRPIPYVVPPLYCLCVLFMILYSAANTFRAWIAYEEKKISKPFRLFCQICYVNLAIAGLLFSLCFAVQPHDHESLIVHTGPFAYFTIALVMNQVSSFNPIPCGEGGGVLPDPPLWGMHQAILNFLTFPNLSPTFIW